MWTYSTNCCYTDHFQESLNEKEQISSAEAGKSIFLKKKKRTSQATGHQQLEKVVVILLPLAFYLDLSLTFIISVAVHYKKPTNSLLKKEGKGSFGIV